MPDLKCRFWRAPGLILALAAASVAPAAEAPRLKATLDRPVIYLNETATLSLVFEGGAPAKVPPPPPVPNLMIQHTTYSTGLSIENNRRSMTMTFEYLVQPQQTGEFIIPPFTANVDGRPLSSPSLKLTVLPGQRPGTDQLAFLRLVVPRESAYVGEAFAVEARLYLHSSVRDVQGFQLGQLKGEGFTVGKTMRAPNSQTRVGAAAYSVISFRTAVTVAKTGPLTLGPIDCRLTLMVSQPGRSRGDIFGILGQPTEARPMNLISEPHQLEGVALPANDLPPHFRGAVGDFSLVTSASPTNVAVGDPVTVEIQIRGTGALESLALPDQPHWDEFRVYPPTRELVVNELGLEGTNVFNLVVVPQNVGVKELPPFYFSYFDPARKEYRTSTQPAAPLVVRPAASYAAPALAPAQTSANPPAPQEIVHIKAQLGTVAGPSPPLAARPWFLTLQTIPPAVWLAALLARKRREHLANNPRLIRRRQVNKLVAASLRQLRQLARGGNSELFFSTLFRMLQERSGEKIDLPASAITEAVIDDHLRGRAVPAELLSALHELFHLCNEARYAPRRTIAELEALLPKIERAEAQLKTVTVS